MPPPLTAAELKKIVNFKPRPHSPHPEHIPLSVRPNPYIDPEDLKFGYIRDFEKTGAQPDDDSDSTGDSLTVQPYGKSARGRRNKKRRARQKAKTAEKEESDVDKPATPRVIIKDVTSTPQREWALFHYGKAEASVLSITGIFSPMMPSDRVEDEDEGVDGSDGESSQDEGMEIDQKSLSDLANSQKGGGGTRRSSTSTDKKVEFKQPETEPNLPPIDTDSAGSSGKSDTRLSVTSSAQTGRSRVSFDLPPTTTEESLLRAFKEHGSYDQPDQSYSTLSSEGEYFEYGGVVLKASPKSPPNDKGKQRQYSTSEQAQILTRILQDGCEQDQDQDEDPNDADILMRDSIRTCFPILEGMSPEEICHLSLGLTPHPHCNKHAQSDHSNQNPPNSNNINVGLEGDSADEFRFMEVEELEGYTAMARKKNLEDLFSAEIPIRTVFNRDELFEYLQEEAEQMELDGDEDQNTIGRLFSHLQCDINEFMSRINETEQDRVNSQRMKSYYDQEAEKPPPPPQFEGWGYDSPSALTLMNPHGWKPVQAGWISWDTSLVCIESGTIPKFFYRRRFWEEEEEGSQEFGPRKPMLFWSGVSSTDDEHANLDISYKLLGFHQLFRETPTGMIAANQSDDSEDSDADYETEEEEDIDWSSRLLNHRLLLTCDSVRGSNTDLTFDPEELDTPTLDFERNYYKKTNSTLHRRYPNTTRIERKFDRMGQLVLLLPEPRPIHLPKRSILKGGPRYRFEPSKKPGGGSSKKKKFVKVMLHEDVFQHTQLYHPQKKGFVVSEHNGERKRMGRFGIREVLPSIRAAFTRVKGYERYYPSFLRPPQGSNMTHTSSYETGYFMNHISRFKLGIPSSTSTASSSNKITTSIKNALMKVTGRRKEGREGVKEYKDRSFKYSYELFGRLVDGKERVSMMVDTRERFKREKRDLGGPYLVYAGRRGGDYSSDEEDEEDDEEDWDEEMEDCEECEAGDLQDYSEEYEDDNGGDYAGVEGEGEVEGNHIEV
ncbi:hypothetical protein AA313_de0203776 [Arthrobotrys entomopaga]|nr:hypothetical protein AA313_de0203776 [Arthrobotrys entomopaga]